MVYIIAGIILLVIVLVVSHHVYRWQQRKAALKNSFKFAIVHQTLDNNNFRKVIATTTQTQVVLMSIPQGSQIGEEIHPTTDQLFFFVKGKATGILNGQKLDILASDMVMVPAGTKHNILNTGTEDLKLYTIYVPPVHKSTTMHATKEDAEKDTSDIFAPSEKK